MKYVNTVAEILEFIANTCTNPLNETEMPNLKSESEFQIVLVVGFSCRKDVLLSVMVM